MIELALSRKKALARELRKLIEPDKAQSKRTIRETEIRKYLRKQDLTYYGITDIISVLKTNYSVANVSRLVSKIQKPVVLDTCMCNLPTQELMKMLCDNNLDCIITTSVYEELLKLSLSSSKTKTGVYNALDLIEKILGDTDSQFCTIVDLPRETCINNYVDNQLLWYCEKNKYVLYTHDYVLGLRAKSKNIDVSIFWTFNKSTLPEYIPNPNGKNIILNSDLLNIVEVTDIVRVAKEIGANKFILTNEFIESLEDGSKTKIFNFELIHFLVIDEQNSYSTYLSSDDSEDIAELAEKYNAIIFSSNIAQCVEYKMNYIPYKLVAKENDQNHFKTRIYSALTLSPYYTSDLTYEDNLDDDIVATSDAENTTESTISNEPKSNNEKLSECLPKSEKDLNAETNSYDISSSNNNINSNSSTKNKKTPLAIPYYKPKQHRIPIKDIALNQKIWVLDAEETELSPNLKSGYDISVGCTIVHIINNLDDTFRLNVYKIINLNPSNYCEKIVSTTFEKKNYANIVEHRYQTFVRRALALT